MPEITGATRLFGILADPVHHVRTPQGINALMRERGRDAVMVPLHVAPAGLQAAVAGLRQWRNLEGCVVTVPHKVPMASLCDELTPVARRIGAVNVIHRRSDGSILGGMLDGDGFVAGLRSQGIEPRGLRAYLAGAGGAASAIGFALAQAGVRQLTIANRSVDKARDLAQRIAAHMPQVAVAVGTRDPSGHELVVNATSLGLHEGDALPLDADRLHASQVVAEIIMQPAETALLRAARAAGCRIQPGAPMLACQIALMAAFMSGERVASQDQ